MRSKLILILAVVMGLITTVLFFNYMKQFDAAATVHETMVEAVAAKQAIKKNQKIGPGMVEIVLVPQLGLHSQALTNTAEVEGKFADADIAAGEILMSGRLKTAKEESQFVARKVREGYRAVSLGVNFVQSVSNLIEPEDDVDVILTTTDKQTGQVQTTLLQEKVRVLAVGRRMVEINAEIPYAEYSSVTLEVKLQEAVNLVNADEKGAVSLAIHSRLQPPNGDGAAPPQAAGK